MPDLSVISAVTTGAALKAHWFDYQRKLFSSKAEGWRIASRLAALMDGYIRHLCDTDEGLTVLAVGGYGQGRLAPYSDVDLLILYSDHVENKDIPHFLYTLWDAGFTVSHALHTPQSAIKAARENIQTCTSFIDARRVMGSSHLEEDFISALDAYRSTTVSAFIDAKLQEQADRHAQADNSIYAIEPDVKDGRGGIRDLQTLHWLKRYQSGIRNEKQGKFDSPGFLSSREKRRLKKIGEFLWSVRVHLHDLIKRADDRLYFPLQSDLAKRMGFLTSTGEPHIDRFLRYYFLTVQEAGRLSELSAARLAEFFEPDEKVTQDFEELEDLGENIRIINGRLSVEVEKVQEPIPAILDLFHGVATTGLDIDSSSFSFVLRHSRRLNYRNLHNRYTADRLSDLVENAVYLEKLFRLMTEAGFLGRMIPAFGAVIGKAEYGLFRRFTLDDHILRSIGVLDNIYHGTDEELDSEDLREIAQMYRIPLAMALLLQEMPSTLKNLGLTQIRKRIERRVGFLLDSPARAKLVAFAVLESALLMRTASRRDVTDAHTIKSVAARLGTRERLDFLSVFTICRQRVAGVGSWDEYHHREVNLLVDVLGLQLGQGESAVTHYLEMRTMRLREDVAKAVGQDKMSAFDQLLKETGPSLWSSLDYESGVRLAQLMAETGEGDGAASLYADDDGILHILVYGNDRPTLFSDCTGLVAMSGGTVFGAAGYAVNVGQIRRGVVLLQVNRAGTPPGPFTLDPFEEDRLLKIFQSAANGKSPDIRMPERTINDRRALFNVKPVIRIDEAASEDALVVEVEALDRPGLLYILSSEMAKIGIEIIFALVATYGHRAVDTFYLRDYPGYKISDPRRIEVIRRQIVRALGEEDDLEDISILKANDDS